MKSHSDAIRLGVCDIHPSATVLPGAIIGKPYRVLLDGTHDDDGGRTVIDAQTYVGCWSIVGAGSCLERGVIVDDHCLIESRVLVGSGTLITYRAHLCCDVKIGPDCVVGGFVGERTQIGARSRVFGDIVHSQRDPTRGWDDEESMEDSAVIEEGSFVGFGAVVIGSPRIGPRAYVCAVRLSPKTYHPCMWRAVSIE